MYAQAEPQPPSLPDIPEAAAEADPRQDRAGRSTDSSADATTIDIGNVRVSNPGAREGSARIGRLLRRNVRAAELGMAVALQGRALQISNLDADGIAAGAGLREGDKVLAVSRTWVRSADELTTQLKTAAQENGRAWLFVERNGDRHWVNLDFSGRGQGAWGILANRQDDQLRVQHVNQGSAAANAGLTVGDRIISVDGVRVVSGRELDGRLRAAARGDGEAELRIVRDGETRDLVAQLRGTAESTENAGAIANARLRRFQNRLDSMIANQDDASTRRLERIRANTEDLRARLAEINSEAGRGEVGDSLRGRLASIGSELRELAEDVNGDRRFDFDEMISLAGDLQRQISSMLATNADDAADNASGFSARARTRAITAVEQLQASLDGLDDQANDNNRQRIAEIRSAAEDLAKRVRELPEDATETVNQNAGQLNQEIAALRRQLNSLSRDAQGELADRIDQARDSLASLSESMSALAQSGAEAVTSTSTDEETKLREQAENILKQLEQISQTAQGELQTRVSEVRDRAAQLRDNLSTADSERLEQIDERLDRARDAVADLYRDVDMLADQGEADLRQQLQELRNSLGQLRWDLSDYARQAVRSASERVFNASEEISDRAQRAMTRVEMLADRLRSLPAEGTEGINERLTTLRDDVEKLRGEVRQLADSSQDANLENLTAARDTGSAIATELQDISGKVEGETRSQLDEMSATAAEISAELQAMAEAANNL